MPVGVLVDRVEQDVRIDDASRAATHLAHQLVVLELADQLQGPVEVHRRPPIACRRDSRGRAAGA
jgi:hypothetical protein